MGKNSAIQRGACMHKKNIHNNNNNNNENRIHVLLYTSINIQLTFIQTHLLAEPVNSEPVNSSVRFSLSCYITSHTL